MAGTFCPPKLTISPSMWSSSPWVDVDLQAGARNQISMQARGVECSSVQGAGDAPELECPSPDAQLVPMASTGEGEWRRGEQEKPAAKNCSRSGEIEAVNCGKYGGSEAVNRFRHLDEGEIEANQIKRNPPRI